MLNLAEVVACRTEIKRPVGGAAALGYAMLVLNEGDGGGLRNAVGHVHERGDTAQYRLTALTGDGGLVRQPRLTEMNMFVNDAWKQMLPFAIYNRH